jgi:hypothetical protein
MNHEIAEPELPLPTAATARQVATATVLLRAMRDRILKVAPDVSREQCEEMDREIGVQVGVMQLWKGIGLDAGIPATAIIADVAVGLACGTVVTTDSKIRTLVAGADRTSASEHFRRELRVVR